MDEKDPIHAVLVAQAELLHEGFRTQTALVKATLDAALSPRAEENRKLSALISACQVPLKEASLQTETIKAFVHGELAGHRAATSQQMEELRRDASRISDAAGVVQARTEKLSELTDNRMAWGLGLAFAGGALVTAAIPMVIRYFFPG